MPSCAACRIRRVKCVDPGENGCKGCRDRGLNCIIPATKPRTVKHKGRLAAAKELFGHAGDGSSGSSEQQPYDDSAGHHPPSSREAQYSAASRALALWSDESHGPSIEGVSAGCPANRLVYSELSSTLAQHLIEQFARDLAMFHPPTIDWDALLAAFRAANRQIELMAPSPQVLILSLLALGARFSSHSALIGFNASSAATTDNATPLPAPDLEQVISPHFRRVWQDESLLKYGKQREAACRYFTTRAKEVIDQTGVALKEPDPMLVAALSEVEQLLLVTPDLEPGTAYQSSRPYGAAAASMMKQISEERAPRLDAEAQRELAKLAITLTMRDAPLSIAAGRTCHFSRDDIEDLGWADFSTSYIPFTEQQLHAVWLGKIDDFGCGFPWDFLIKISFDISDSLVRTAKQANPVLDVAKCYSILQNLTSCEAVLRSQSDVLAQALNARRQQPLGGRFLLADDDDDDVSAAAAANNNNNSSSSTANTTLRVEGVKTMQRLCKYYQSFLTLQLWRIVEKRCSPAELDRAAKHMHSARNQIALAEYTVTLLALRSEVHQQVLLAARQVVSVINDILTTTSGIQLLCPGSLLLENLSVWIGIVVQAETNEEGGHLSYSRADKMYDLDILHLALCFVSWSWPYTSRLLEQVNRCMETLSTQADSSVSSAAAAAAATAAEAAGVDIDHDEILLSDQQEAFFARFESHMNALSDSNGPQWQEQAHPRSQPTKHVSTSPTSNTIHNVASCDTGFPTSQQTKVAGSIGGESYPYATATTLSSGPPSHVSAGSNASAILQPESGIHQVLPASLVGFGRQSPIPDISLEQWLHDEYV